MLFSPREYKCDVFFFFISMCSVAEIEPQQQKWAGSTEPAEEIRWNPKIGDGGSEKFQEQRLQFSGYAPRHGYWSELMCSYCAVNIIILPHFYTRRNT